MIIFAWLVAFSVTVFGLVLLRKVGRRRVDNPVLFQLLKDGLRTLQVRMLSAVLQFVLYMTIIVYLGSTIFGVGMSWEQFLAAWIGALITLFGAVLSLQLASPMIQYIFDKSKVFYETSLTAIVTCASGITSFIFGLTALGLVSVVTVFGLPASVGFCVGVAAAAVCIKMGGSIFRSSSMNGLAITQRMRPKQPLDARNPGALLEIMGDLVDNLSGFVADLLTSFSLAFAACFLFVFMQVDSVYQPQVASFFILIFCVIVGLTPFSLLLPFLRIGMKKSANILWEAVYLGLLLCCLGILGGRFVFPWLMGDIYLGKFLWPFLIGVIGAALIGFSSEYLTRDRFPPVKYLARLAERSAILVVKQGMAYGFLANGVYFLCLSVLVMLAVSHSGAFGLLLVTLGMLSVVGPILAVIAVNPIAESAHKLARLSVGHPTVINNLKRASQLGATTMAFQSGFLSVTSVLASAAMIFTLISVPGSGGFFIADTSVWPMAGFIVGLGAPYVIAGLILKRDQYATATVIDEINRQFDEIPFLTENKAKPDVVIAADRLARIANDSLIFPIIVIALLPIIVAFLCGSLVLLAFSGGVFISALSGYCWAITGDSLLQAKGYIQNGSLGGEGTPRYAESLTSGLIGTAFGKILSPSAAVLIKAVTIITVLLVLFVQ